MKRLSFCCSLLLPFHVHTCVDVRYTKYSINIKVPARVLSIYVFLFPHAIVLTIYLLLPSSVFVALPCQRSALGVLWGKMDFGGTSFVQKQCKDDFCLGCNSASFMWGNSLVAMITVTPIFRVAIPSKSLNWPDTHQLNIPKYQTDQKHFHCDMVSDGEQITGFVSIIGMQLGWSWWGGQTLL